jgi:hypothetical protein
VDDAVQGAVLDLGAGALAGGLGLDGAFLDLVAGLGALSGSGPQAARSARAATRAGAARPRWTRDDGGTGLNKTLILTTAPLGAPV